MLQLHSVILALLSAAVLAQYVPKEIFSFEMAVTLEQDQWSQLNNVTAANKTSFEAAMSTGIKDLIPNASGVSTAVVYDNVMDIGVTVSASSAEIEIVRSSIYEWPTDDSPVEQLVVNMLKDVLGIEYTTPISVARKAAPCRNQTFLDSIVPSTQCSDVTQFAITGTNFVSTTIKALLCDGMDISSDCDNKITLTQASSTSVQGSISLISDGTLRLLTLVQIIRHGTQFNAYSISSVMTGSIQLYSSTEITLQAQQDNSVPEEAPGCEEKDYWWLVFLILVLPVSFIIIRHGYRRGRKKGQKQQREKIKEEERDVVQPRHINQRKPQPGGSYPQQGYGHGPPQQPRSVGQQPQRGGQYNNNQEGWK